jgi:hypothetical protein
VHAAIALATNVLWKGNAGPDDGGGDMLETITCVYRLFLDINGAGMNASMLVRSPNPRIVFYPWLHLFTEHRAAIGWLSSGPRANEAKKSRPGEGMDHEAIATISERY